MNKKYQMGHKRGFTLIELLVVISIVSLLSSVVLASLQSARKKADDTQRNQIVGEYVKALTLVYDNTGSYPTPATPITTPRCLGDYTPTGSSNHNTTIVCRRGGAGVKYNEDLTVLDAVNNYLTSLPTLKIVSTSATNAYDGPFYYCTGADCSTPTIEWYLEQPNAKCIKGAIATNTTYTKCLLTLN